MIDRNWLGKLTGNLLVTVLILVLLVPAAMAQGEPDPQEEQTVSQTATQPAPYAKPGPDPGPFAKGKVRVGFYGGAGSTLGQTYVILGAGAGYYLMDGLEAGVDLEGWVLQSPAFWKVTPQVRYVLWQVSPIRPYVGAFWRHTFVTGDNSQFIPDYDSYGGRLGIAYRKGGNYLAVGAVYEKFIDSPFTDDSIWYPEIAFWVSF